MERKQYTTQVAATMLRDIVCGTHISRSLIVEFDGADTSSFLVSGLDMMVMICLVSGRQEHFINIYYLELL